MKISDRSADSLVFKQYISELCEFISAVFILELYSINVFAIFAGGGSRKGSRSNTPTIVEEVVNDHSPTQQPEEERPQNAGDTQRTQPTVIEPVDLELPGFNIDDFLGDIIGYPGEWIGNISVYIRC